MSPFLTSPLSSDRRDELIKIFELRLERQPEPKFLDSVESILKNYSSLLNKIRSGEVSDQPENYNDNVIKQGLDFLRIQKMERLSPDDQDKLIKIADILRGVSTNSLLEEVEEIIDSYLAELQSIKKKL